MDNINVISGKNRKRKDQLGDVSSSKKHKYGSSIYDIPLVAAEKLDWSDKCLVTRFRYYMSQIDKFTEYGTRTVENILCQELFLIEQIKLKKKEISALELNKEDFSMDDIDDYDSEIRVDSGQTD